MILPFLMRMAIVGPESFFGGEGVGHGFAKCLGGFLLGVVHN